jgi:uncharacterized protein
MLISIRELALHPLDFERKFAPDTIDLGPDARQAEPLLATGRAQLVQEHRGPRQVLADVRLTGKLATQLEVPCARCLEPVRRDVQRDFELLYRPLGADRGKSEAAVSEDESEIGYYEGEGLLLEEVLREQLLLAVPMRAVCREDCKGLCLQCGGDLNAGGCQCPPPQADPRWSALKDLKQ